MRTQSTPLGYIQLYNGAKPIYPMDDFFVNWRYRLKENWEELRLIINTILVYYIMVVPTTHLTPITGKIKVQTQYEQLSETKTTPMSQDIEITDEDGNIWYIEFQIEPYPDTPIRRRSVRYFGMGISRSKKEPAEQIWLLAEDIPELMHGQEVMRYVLKSEAGGQTHPIKAGILYVSLSKLAEQATPIGELAATLLGTIETPTSQPARQVAESLKDAFNRLKDDKEAVSMMTLVERRIDDNKNKWLAEGRAKGRAEGRAEGEAKGRAEGISSLVDLIKRGLNIDEALQALEAN